MKSLVGIRESEEILFLKPLINMVVSPLEGFVVFIPTAVVGGKTFPPCSPRTHWELSGFFCFLSMWFVSVFMSFLVRLSIFCYRLYSFCVNCLFLVLAY